MEKKKKIELDYPIEVDVGEGRIKRISEITIGRMKVKHFKVLPKGFIENEGKNIQPSELLPLIAAMAGLTVEQADEIDLQDLMKIANELQGFLEGSLAPTGKN